MSNRYFNRTSRFNCGEAINWAIDHTDYKKKEIANFLHISPSTLTGYLTNNRTPDIYTLLKLCDICKIEPNQLFGYRLSLYIMNKKEQETLLSVDLETPRRFAIDVTVSLPDRLYIKTMSRSVSLQLISFYPKPPLCYLWLTIPRNSVFSNRFQEKKTLSNTTITSYSPIFLSGCFLFFPLHNDFFRHFCRSRYRIFTLAFW